MSNLFKILSFLLISFSICLAQTKDDIAILDLEGNIPTQHLSALSSRLRSEIFLTNQFNIYEREKLYKILEEINLQLTGCTDTECAVEIGEIVGVKKVVLGRIDQINKDYYISIKLINVETSKIEKSVTIDCETCTINEIMKKTLPKVAESLSTIKQESIKSKCKGLPFLLQFGLYGHHVEKRMNKSDYSHDSGNFTDLNIISKYNLFNTFEFSANYMFEKSEGDEWLTLSGDNSARLLGKYQREFTKYSLSLDAYIFKTNNAFIAPGVSYGTEKITHISKRLAMNNIDIFELRSNYYLSSLGAKILSKYRFLKNEVYFGMVKPIKDNEFGNSITSDGKMFNTIIGIDLFKILYPTISFERKWLKVDSGDLIDQRYEFMISSNDINIINPIRINFYSSFENQLFSSSSGLDYKYNIIRVGLNIKNTYCSPVSLN